MRRVAMADILEAIWATTSIRDMQGISETSTMASQQDHTARLTLLTTIRLLHLIIVVILPVSTTRVREFLRPLSLLKPKEK